MSEHSHQRWDAIVVGAGLGGLTCAAYLAAAGKRVLVVEQFQVAGGNSHVFRRRRQYQFDVGVHYLGDCGDDGVIPAILSGLGVRDRVPLRELDRNCVDRIMTPDGSVAMPADWAGYRERIQALFPAETEAIADFLRVIRLIGEWKRSALLTEPDADADGMWAVKEWGNQPLTALFDHYQISSGARTVLAAQSPNYGIAPQVATVSMHAVVTDHYVRGAWFPLGGGQMLAAALLEVIRANGGQLRTGARVDKILVNDGTAHGVRLADGEEVSAPIVVSNADFRRTMLQLVGREHLPPAMAKWTEKATMAMPFATVYVALDRELVEQHESNIWWYDTDDIEGYYKSLMAGEQPDRIRFLFISFGSLKDPDSRMCPPGHTNLELMTLCPPQYSVWGTDDGPADGNTGYRRQQAYQDEKRRFTDEVISAAEKLLGPIRANLVHAELSTPLTHERYTLSTGGTPFGVATWGRAGSRPDTATSVAGLTVVGQSTRYGNGITGVMCGGVVAAGQILGLPLMRDVYAGSVIGDTSLLPSRPTDWDPLQYCKGDSTSTSADRVHLRTAPEFGRDRVTAIRDNHTGDSA